MFEAEAIFTPFSTLLENQGERRREKEGFLGSLNWGSKWLRLPELLPASGPGPLVARSRTCREAQEMHYPKENTVPERPDLKHLLEVLKVVAEALIEDGHSPDFVIEAFMTEALTRKAKQRPPIAITRDLLSAAENFLAAARAEKQKEWVN
jgi:hypothetical protein